MRLLLVHAPCKARFNSRNYGTDLFSGRDGPLSDGGGDAQKNRGALMLGQRIVGYAAGAILIAAVWMMSPPVGTICAAIITAELLLRIALWVRQVFVNRQLRFQSLSQNEQALRRGSQGFALMVFAALAAVVPPRGISVKATHKPSWMLLTSHLGHASYYPG